jgi:predicted DNA-binding transcriptional regulator YafY
MNSKSNKKVKSQLLPVSLTALKILQILEERSDQAHPVAQTTIAEELDIDRKTVARCLDVMEGYMDYDIVHQRKGVYLVPNEDAFELSEVRLLIDSVLASKVVSAEQTDVIVQKLANLLNKHDRTHIRHIHSYKDWSKVDNKNIFWTIEVFDDAINKNVKVSFDYNTIGTDKKLHVDGNYTVSPIQLTFANGQYFVLAYTENDDELRNFRIDKITDAKLLGAISQNKQREVGWRDIASTYVEGHPYMSFGNTERIRLRIIEDEIGRVFDVFGTNVRVSQCHDDKTFANMVEVCFDANTEDVYKFMVQNADVAEIMEPHSIRARILEFGRQMHVRYLSSKEDWARANYESAINGSLCLSHSACKLNASDRDVRNLIVKNNTADKVWGINVDAYDAKTFTEISEYSNLQILEFDIENMPDEIDLSIVKYFPGLHRMTIEQRSRKKPPVKIRNLEAIKNCKKINQLQFFNVEFIDDVDFSGFEKLRLLNLRHCKLKNLDFLRSMNELMRLEISGACVDDISGLIGHKRLRVLTIDTEFVEKFDIDALKKANPKLRVEIHSRQLLPDEDSSINHSLKDLK